MSPADGSDRLPHEGPIDARRLLGERREAILMLDGEAYRLRITANRKLILTK